MARFSTITFRLFAKPFVTAFKSVVAILVFFARKLTIAGIVVEVSTLPQLARLHLVRTRVALGPAFARAFDESQVNALLAPGAIEMRLTAPTHAPFRNGNCRRIAPYPEQRSPKPPTHVHLSGAVYPATRRSTVSKRFGEIVKRLTIFAFL